MKTTTTFAFLSLLLCSASAAQAVTFDWATVGNPGNAADQDYGAGRFGAVDYTYRISKYEVTNDQYAEFLNNVAASDPNGLFDSSMDITQNGADGSFSYTVNAGFESNPVHVVSFIDSMRFVNWLENGQPTGGQAAGTTEEGVYTIGTGVSETRAAGATFFIPSEDEWYKAAYHDPRLAADGGPPGDDNYWLCPTQSDAAPTAEGPPGGENSANRANAVGSKTDVGAYVDTTSFYGTFDQGGNVTEWNEATIGSFRSIRGGDWGDFADLILSASFGQGSDPSAGFTTGIRVASIYQPIITPGDANGDGKVDGVDYITWAFNFGDDPADDPPGSPANGDFNDDGVVDGVDYVTWAINFGQGPNDATSVPEPSGLVLAVLANLGLLVRRRR